MTFYTIRHHRDRTKFLNWSEVSTIPTLFTYTDAQFVVKNKAHDAADWRLITVTVNHEEAKSEDKQ